MQTPSPSTDLDRPDLDPRPFLTAATTTTAAVIAGIRPEQFGAPTPCSEYDVRGLLAHLVAVAHRVAAVGRGINPMSVADSAPASSDVEWIATWQAAVADADAAWTDAAALERTVVLPWATGTGARALLGYVSEITVHTWDVAKATGQQPAWDEEAARCALELMREWLPGAHRAEIFAEVRKQMGPERASDNDAFAEAVTVPADAPAIDQLVAWTGRQP